MACISKNGVGNTFCITTTRFEVAPNAWFLLSNRKSLRGHALVAAESIFGNLLQAVFGLNLIT